jgi:hypothetical protein
MTDPLAVTRGLHDGEAGSNDAGGAVARDETMSLISSDKVEGTAVYGAAGNRLGSIGTLMIDKARGKVEYAVLTFGGIMGIGSRHFPLPWSQLRYDTALGGYVVNLTEEQLRDAPSYDAAEPVNLTDNAWGEKVHGYYGPSLYMSGMGM